MFLLLISLVLSAQIGNNHLLGNLVKSPVITSFGYYVDQKISDDQKNFVELRKNISFKEQVIYPNTVYEICGDFDLSETFKGLKLYDRCIINNQVYFSHFEAISLEKGQKIWAPKGCFILNAKKQRVLTQDSYYQAGGQEEVYIASKYKKKIKYKKSGEIKVPDGCELVFNKGRIANGRINFNNCTIKGHDNCLASIYVTGRCSSKCSVDWFSDMEDAGRIESALTLSNEVIFSNRDYCIERPIKLYDKNHVKIYGNGAKLNYKKPCLISFEDCSDLRIEQLYCCGNNISPRLLLFSNGNNIHLESCYFSNVKDKNNKSGVFCCYFSNCSNISVNGCHFSDVEASAMNGTARGLYFAYDKARNQRCNNITIEGCVFDNIHAPSIFEGKGKDDSDCIYISGIYVEDGYANATISNCRFVDFGKRGVKAQARGVTVKDCAFIDVDDSKAHKHWRAVELFGSESSVGNCTIQLKNFERAIQIYNEGEIVLNNGKPSKSEDLNIHGIRVENNVIEKPFAEDVSYGVFVGGSEKNLCEYKNVAITDNVINGVYCGIKMTGYGDDVTVENNDISAMRNGIIFSSEKVDGEMEGKSYSFKGVYTNCVVSNNTIVGFRGENNTPNKGTAIQFNCNKSIVSNNTIENYNRGITSDNDDVTIMSNELLGVKYEIQSNGRNSIVKNNILRR